MTSICRKIIRKLQAYYFNMKLSMHGFLELPVQTEKERRIFKAILDQAGDGEVLKIFEWGSGYSTLYYAAYLLQKGVDYEWHSIDNNRGWHEKVMQLVDEKKLQSKVRLYLMEFKPFWEKPGWGSVPPPCGLFVPCSENEKNYINFPRQLGENFDVVIVDARFRRHCIQTTKEVLLPEGIAILHDAQKTHYHIGLDDFRYRKFLNTGSWYPFQKILNKIWIGSMGNSKIFETLKGF
jgi:hypothetical protein